MPQIITRRDLANNGQGTQADDRGKSYTEADTSVYFPTSFDSEPTDMNERVGNQNSITIQGRQRRQKVRPQVRKYHR